MKSVIIGAGKYGEVYLSYLKEDGVDVIGFLDDNPLEWDKTIYGIPVLGPISKLESLKSSHNVEAVYCPLGNNRLRVQFLTRARSLGYVTPNFIHRDVHISPNVVLDNEGVYILGNTYIMPEVTIEKDVMISVSANIIHHTILHQGVFISNGVNLGASLDAMDYAYIGMGATVMTGVKTLGTDCLIGAGAVVIKDVPAGAVMAGVPAKVIKYKDGYPKPLNEIRVGGGTVNLQYFSCITMKGQLNSLSGLTLYGAGGHCKVVIDILDNIGVQIDQIVDDNSTDSTFMSIPCDMPNVNYEKVIVTIGNCQIRRQIVERIKVKHYITAIHPSAIISPHCMVDAGTVIMQGVIVQSCASVGKHCILNTKSSIDHDVKIHDFVHIASGATICGGSEVGECTWIGAGAVVKQGIRIGKNCMIGAGSVVISDIPDNVVAYGNPCRVIRMNI